MLQLNLLQVLDDKHLFELCGAQYTEACVQDNLYKHVLCHGPLNRCLKKYWRHGLS